jgi:hypothetical protein
MKKFLQTAANIILIWRVSIILILFIAILHTKNIILLYDNYQYKETKHEMHTRGCGWNDIK